MLSTLLQQSLGQEGKSDLYPNPRPCPAPLVMLTELCCGLTSQNPNPPPHPHLPGPNVIVGEEREIPTLSHNSHFGICKKKKNAVRFQPHMLSPHPLSSVFYDWYTKQDIGKVNTPYGSVSWMILRDQRSYAIVWVFHESGHIILSPRSLPEFRAIRRNDQHFRQSGTTSNSQRSLGNNVRFLRMCCSNVWFVLLNINKRGGCLVKDVAIKL